MGLAINNLVSLNNAKNPSLSMSKFLQCTSTTFIEWTFDDLACTDIDSVEVYEIGGFYQFNNVIINAIKYCPDACIAAHDHYSILPIQKIKNQSTRRSANGSG